MSNFFYYKPSCRYRTREIFMKNKTSSLFLGFTMSCSALTFGLASAQAAPAADCASLVGCAERSCKIEALIVNAKAKGYDKMVAQLQSSLELVKANCTDKGLKSDLHTEIAAVQLQLESYQDELKAAKAANKLELSYKYAQKVLAEKYKLAQLKQELARMSNTEVTKEVTDQATEDANQIIEAF
ncbi:DUF1090 family protein [Shewanella sp. 125m-1]